MKDFVIDLLKSNIPAHYHYPNYEHTLYVFTKIIEIGTHEKVPKMKWTLPREPLKKAYLEKLERFFFYSQVLHDSATSR